MMMGIRFHGRGGQGIKTASRILGRAAFLAGYQVQDSPLFGAERRGAPVVAWTRISRRPILDRGVLASPDLIVVGDPSLLELPAAGVGLGGSTARLMLVNRPRSAGQNAGTTSPDAMAASQLPRVVDYDLTERAGRLLGRSRALSSGLGAAAAGLCGLVNLDQLLTAMRAEFDELQVAGRLLEANLQLAELVFTELAVQRSAGAQVGPRGEAGPELPEQADLPELVEVRYEGPRSGAPSILSPGNSWRQQTGAWRVERPVVDRERCTRCGLCVLRCPDGAIAIDDGGYPVIDYEHCKGCMICGHECPVLAVQTVRETEAW